MLSLPLIETVVSVITSLMAAGGLAALFLLMAVESFGLPPLPSEIILPFAGFLIYEGTFSWPGAFLAALLGGVTGSFIAYAIGRWGRHWLERPAGRLRLDPKHLALMDDWFRRHGEGTVLFTRLLPIIRSYISYPAGTARMEPARFGVYTAIGATPFTLGLLYAGYVLRSDWSALEPYFRVADYVGAVLIVLGLLYLGLRWRNVLAPGWPPRRMRAGSPPEAPAPPRAAEGSTEPRSGP